MSLNGSEVFEAWDILDSCGLDLETHRKGDWDLNLTTYQSQKQP